MASEGAVGVVLVLEDPLAGDDIGTRRARDKPPGAVVDERPVLVNPGLLIPCREIEIGETPHTLIGG